MVTSTERKIAGMAVSISDEDRAKITAAIDEILRKGFLMWGDWQERLCEGFKQMTGREHAVTFNSCTSALEVLFRFLRENWRAGSVCFQANAFPSPVFAAQKVGLQVRWVDIDPELLCPSLHQIDDAYSRSMFDVLVLQWTGGYMSPEIREIERWCDDRAILLIEDASHAAGSVVYVGEKRTPIEAGSFGTFSVFSLAATKPLQGGQGGVLLTNSPVVAKYVFQAKNYGRTEMFQKGEYVQHGGNLHMTELQAAVAAILMESMDEAIAYREGLARAMIDDFSYDDVQALGSSDGQPNLYKLPIQVRADVRKQDLQARFAERSIELGSSIYDFVTPHLPVFGGQYDGLSFPRSKDYAARHICLPLHNAMTLDDAARVHEALVEVLK